tara:strand:+ start:798 stop:1589 length:792 start_codon:yes stop_codon:yes gene_type:complete
MKKRIIQRQRGFSLIELSIVLIIIGLVTGGILTGQSLIRASQLRSVVTEFQRYETAVYTFRDEYNALPGDMRNAEKFWGSMTNCGVPNPSGTGTCNGNGDGTLYSALAPSETGEGFMFWQHLAKAGLIEGSYTGIAGPVSVRDFNFGENSPASKLTNAGWGIFNFDRTGVTGPGTAFSIDFANHFEFGAEGDNIGADAAILTPEEAWNIDTKVDDGKPGLGNIIGGNSVNTCTTAVNQEDFMTAEYLVSSSTVGCSLRYINIF